VLQFFGHFVLRVTMTWPLFVFIQNNTIMQKQIKLGKKLALRKEKLSMLSRRQNFVLVSTDPTDECSLTEMACSIAATSCCPTAHCGGVYLRGKERD